MTHSIRLHSYSFKVIFTLLLTAQSMHCMQWNPEFYGTSELPTTVYHALKEVPKLQLHGNESVLDVGCGDGTTSALIAKTYLPNGTMHGIDNSPSMIDAAVKNSCANTTFECASLLNYEPDHLYDVVVCFWVLYLMDDYATALNRTMTYLKPGGKALICHIIEPGTPFYQLFKKKIYPKAMPFTLPSFETVMHAIQHNDYEIEYLEVKQNYSPYNNMSEFCSKMKKIPFFSLLDAQQEIEFHQELSTLYQPAQDGSVTDSVKVVCMILKK